MMQEMFCLKDQVFWEDLSASINDCDRSSSLWSGCRQGHRALKEANGKCGCRKQSGVVELSEVLLCVEDIGKERPVALSGCCRVSAAPQSRGS